MSIIDKINKVQELIKRGSTKGEKAAAEEALKRIAEANNLDYEELLKSEKDRYFTYSTLLDMFLFENLVRHLLGNSGPLRITTKAARKKRYIIELDHQEYILLESAYEYFKRDAKPKFKKYSYRTLKRYKYSQPRKRARVKLMRIFVGTYLIESGIIPEASIKQASARDSQLGYGAIEGGKFKTQVQTGLYLGQ
jgi:hypothetical protein